MSTKLSRKVLTTNGLNVVVSESFVTFEKGNEKLVCNYDSAFVGVEHTDNVLSFFAKEESADASMMLGTAIATSANHMKGLLTPFTIKLVLKGTGFKAALKKDNNGQDLLVLCLGKSHDDNFVVPSNVKISVPSPTSIVLQSANKQAVGQASAKIRAFRKPNAYKEKGIMVEGVVVTLKETKKKK